MNTSSQQSINAANLQFATQQASGAFLPTYYANQVAGAKAAGINPLAVIGSGSGAASAPERIGTQPGAGLQDFGKALMAGNFDPHVQAMKDAELTKAQVDIANARAAGNNTAIQIARSMWEMDQMRKWYADPTHRDAPPPGASPTSVPDAAQRDINSFQSRWDAMGAGINSMMSRIPASMWNTP